MIPECPRHREGMHNFTAIDKDVIFCSYCGGSVKITEPANRDQPNIFGKET